MNSRQLVKLGVPEDCTAEAIAAIQVLNSTARIRKPDLRQKLQAVVAHPRDFVDDLVLSGLARAILEDRDFERPPPVEYQTWGAGGIDAAAHKQMAQACSVPVAIRGALMPDAHVGYGLPIGGVLACENAVIPYAVGVDIACRMKLSLLDIPVQTIDSKPARYDGALERGTRFGVGAEHEHRQSHSVLDEDWDITSTTRQMKDRAWRQLGTSGAGNHFVEFGVVTLETPNQELGVPAGQYVGLLSHSGSRGPGASVCSFYSAIARARLPKKYADLAYLAWLDLDTEAGQEYWAAMNLMGNYASANHDVIHRLVSKQLGAAVLGSIENHHNLAWLEEHDGRVLVVHRKGATPAGEGVWGIIPGTMADPAFIVRGQGNAQSLNSASHGAGRQLSRRAAKDRFRWKAVKNDLARKGIRVLSAAADEVPGAYKDIETVMREQADLVEVMGRFQPRIVKMCDDGSKAED